MHPKARSTDILAQEVDGELVLYDTVRHAAHRLNGPAARIWRHCDGQTSVADIARRIASPSEPVDEATVLAGLDALREAALLAEPPTVSRRAVVRQLAMAAGAALVVSIAAPTPADALSDAHGGGKGKGGGKGGGGKGKGKGKDKGKDKDKDKGKGNDKGPGKGRGKGH